MTRPHRTVLILGPSREALSGVTTHVNTLLDSALAAEFSLVHFQVGSEGRRESALRRAGRLARSPWELAAAILRHEVAIVHVNCSLNAKSWWRDLVYAGVAKLCGARVVLQKHGGELGAFCANRLFRTFVRRALRLADAIVVLSRGELEQYRRFVPGRLVAAVPNGIAAEAFLGCGRDRVTSNAPLRLLYIGRLARGKGLDETIEALALSRAKGVPARLTIAGSGPEEASLRARVRAQGLEGEVRFAGPALGEPKKRLLAEADVLVLASHTEGLPYALLEGMAAGLVPLVTPVGAIPDVVTEGVHGRFVAPGDAAAIAQAIAALEADRRALGRMSEACRRRIAVAYSVERLAQDFSALYSSLLPWPASQAG